jgi:hypothetical protein
MVCLYGSDVMRMAVYPKCENCVHRILINVYRIFFDQEEQKQEQYYICALSYCPYDRAEDKFGRYLDSVGL